MRVSIACYLAGALLVLVFGLRETFGRVRREGYERGPVTTFLLISGAAIAALLWGPLLGFVVLRRLYRHSRPR